MTRKRNKERTSKNPEGTDTSSEIFEEILRWIKVSSIPTVKKVLMDTLTTPEEKLVYHFSDGRSSRDIQKHTGVPFQTVISWWKKWFDLALVKPMRVKRGIRYQRVFSLEALNIPISKSKPEKKKSERKQRSQM